MGIFLGREHMAEQFDVVLAREYSAAVLVPGQNDYEQMTGQVEFELDAVLGILDQTKALLADGSGSEKAIGIDYQAECSWNSEQGPGRTVGELEALHESNPEQWTYDQTCLQPHN
jgi:hypothetical protein